jgi:hypothetical protein
MSTVWIKGTIYRCSLGDGIHKELLNAAWVDLKMELVRDGV